VSASSDTPSAAARYLCDRRPAARIAGPQAAQPPEPATQFPFMTALADEFALADPDERFNLLIDIFVDGLSRRAAQP
jgi:hypothetical protein